MFPVKNADGVSEARRLYSYMCELPHGTTVTYEQLDKVLGRDSRINRSPIKQVKSLLERHAKRTLDNERGVGYRIAHPNEHAEIAMRRVAKSRRVLNSAVSVARAADHSQLTSEESAHLDHMSTLLTGMQRTQKDFAAELRELRNDTRELRQDNRDLRRDTNTELASIQAQLDALKAAQEANGITPVFSSPAQPNQPAQIPAPAHVPAQVPAQAPAAQSTPTAFTRPLRGGMGGATTGVAGLASRSPR
jgi:hypothetical protein